MRCTATCTITTSRVIGGARPGRASLPSELVRRSPCASSGAGAPRRPGFPLSVWSSSVCANREESVLCFHKMQLYRYGTSSECTIFTVMYRHHTTAPVAAVHRTQRGACCRVAGRRSRCSFVALRCYFLLARRVLCALRATRCIASQATRPCSTRANTCMPTRLRRGARASRLPRASP